MSKYIITNEDFYVRTMVNRAEEKLEELNANLKEDEIIILTIEKVNKL